MRTQALLGGIVLAGLLATACQHQEPADSKDSPTAAASSTDAPASSASQEPGESAWKVFSPPTEPCSLVAADQLNNQGAAPIKATSDTDSESHVAECGYEDSSQEDILDVKLLNNADGAENFRSFKLRTINADGVEIFVMVDEPAKCGAGLLGPDNNVVQFEFDPSDSAVSAAALPADKTWCDFSAPIMAEAAKKLGWAK